MKVTELRVGNLIYLPHEDKQTVVDRDMFSVESGLSNLEDYRPIPLSPEWLEKFGVNEWFGDNRYEIIKNNDSSFSIYAWSAFSKCFIRHLEYVHELQNTWPILTGEELQIKNP